MSHVCMKHVTHINQVCQHVTHMNEVCQHVTHMNEVCHVRRVAIPAKSLSPIEMRHVTYERVASHRHELRHVCMRYVACVGMLHVWHDSYHMVCCMCGMTHITWYVACAA